MWHHGIEITKENDGTIVYAVEINETDVPPDVHVASGYVLHHPDGSKVNIITEVHDRERFDRWTSEDWSH